MSCIIDIIQSLQKFLWSLPMLVILLGTHIYFTVRLHVIQRKIPQGIRLSISDREEAGSRKGEKAGREGNVSPFSALATSLAATIGTGNIVGISTAVAIGGPGAVFWCWITGVLGIATCYAECYLSVRFRMKQEDGTFRGGPMYVMEHVLHQKSAAVLFAFSVILVSLGMGSSVQSHSIAAAVLEQKAVSPQLIGLAAAALTGIVIVGGAGQIAKICTWLVPFMSIFYLGGCFLLIWLNRGVLPETLLAILQSAFSSRSVIGGAAGTAVMTGIRTGISRGLFTNEAGLGSIPMAAAAARTDSPRQQGLVSMTGTFWDTVVMCAITGIAVVSSMLKSPEIFKTASPDQLCFLAFSQLDGVPGCLFGPSDTGQSFRGRQPGAFGGTGIICVCYDHRLEFLRGMRGPVLVGTERVEAVSRAVYFRRIPGGGPVAGPCMDAVRPVQFVYGSAKSALPVDAA